MIVKVGDKEYDVKEAVTIEEKKQGLKGIKELKDNEGMLFYFDPYEESAMWMEDTLIPLDIIFINDDQEVTKVHKGIPNDKTLISSPETAYVLEVNVNSGIKVGDEVELEDIQNPVMKVLAPDGSIQMNLWGGERIFRRAFTKQLIRLVKDAEALKNDSYKYSRMCIRIGKKMFKEINAQDTREPEYVSSPNSK